MKGRLSTLGIAAISGIVGALAIGAVVSAGASEGGGGWEGGGSVAQQGVGQIVAVDGGHAAAGGESDTDAFGSGNFTSLENDCHKAGCDLAASFGGGGGSGGSGWSGKGGGGGEAASAASVNSSGNSANSNTNTLASNTQVGVQQETDVRQDNTQVAVQVAVQEQEQNQQQQQQQQQTQCNDQGGQAVSCTGDAVPVNLDFGIPLGG